MTEELLYNGPVAGSSFEPAKSNIKRLWEHSQSHEGEDIDIYLFPDPDNLHDTNAIEIVISGYFVGFVPRPVNAKLIHIGLDKCEVLFQNFSFHPQTKQVVGIYIDIVKKEEL